MKPSEIFNYLMNHGLYELIMIILLLIMLVIAIFTISLVFILIKDLMPNKEERKKRNDKYKG